MGVTVQRLLDNMSLGLWLFQQGQVSRKALQVFVGKEVHTLQFRRPLFSVYDHVWKLISGESDRPFMDEKAISEVVTALGLFPLRFTDWRTQMDPYVMASDVVVEDFESLLPEVDSDASSDGSVAAPSEGALEDDDFLNQLEVPQKDVDEAEVHKGLMVKMVHIFLRRVEHRGSDNEG